MTKSRNDRRLTFRLPEKLVTELNDLAKEFDVTPSWLIRKYVKEAIEARKEL